MMTWQQWEGRIVNGRLPLRLYLGGSKQSAVYLTEIEGSKAAIKLIPSDAADAQLRISRWQSAGKLPHPHLLRILDTGRWHPEGEQEMAFAVMEYADENLAEILPSRQLTPAEATEMLRPTLDVLDYLHGHGMVHGNIKPANIMAVQDTLKLSSDGIRPVGSSEQPTKSRSVYEPSEWSKGEISLSGDFWSLGIVLVEALTNRLPAQRRIDENELELPENIPQPFLDITKHCLRLDSGRRWSTAEIRERLNQAPVAIEEPVAIEKMSAVTGDEEGQQPPALRNATSLHNSETIVEPLGWTGKWRGIRLAIAVGVTVLVVAAGVRLFHHGSETRPPASSISMRPSAESSPQPTRNDGLGVTKTARGAADHGAVNHQVLPDVPPIARNTITGKVRVTVKVAVDKSGAVLHAALVSRGPSEYFANQALQAARVWTFTPPTIDGRAIPSEWRLNFEFRKNGATAVAQRTSPSS